MFRVNAFIAVLVFSLLQGCVTADRFGKDSDSPGGDNNDAIPCDGDEDCWDGLASTEDICGPGGVCSFLPIDDTDTGTDTGEEQECAYIETIDGDDVVDIYFDVFVSELTHTQALVNGRIVRIQLDEPRSLWIGAEDFGQHDVMYVLLDDCANSAFNRIAWGKTIESPELDPGDYYLGVFSQSENQLSMDARYLKSLSCDDATLIKAGQITDNLLGLADDFMGSCVEDDMTGPRGDKVYTFTVPTNEVWDVRVDLYPLGASLGHHMYLNHGCGQQVVEEIDCQMDYAGPTNEHEPGRKRVSLHGAGLGPGDYYLFVDTTEALTFDAGPFELDFQVEVAASH